MSARLNITARSHIQYRYENVDGYRDIRLLHLKPGKQTAPIQISIFHANLDLSPTYEALSYTWGDPSNPTLIQCNEDGDVLSITRNCEEALRRLRLEDGNRTLWIDAICIDQSNISERGQQVQLMASIYQQAQLVLAYLGESTPEIQVGMDFILQHAESSISGADRPALGLDQSHMASPQQEGIDSILALPYFERIWVVQEIVFARNVQVILVGRAVDWKAFSRAAFYVDLNKQMHHGPSYGKRPPAVVFWRDKSIELLSSKICNDMPQSLLELLRATRKYKATDPRDKIHALLGMSSERGESGLTPDYSLTTRETFMHLAKFLIGRDRRLDILCHVQGTSSIHELPSWVPDWSFSYVPEVIGHKKDSVRPYRASLGLAANLSFAGQDSSTLIAEGKIFDKITKVGPVYRMGMESSTTDLRQWEAIAAALTGQTNVEKSTAFMDTLVAYPPYGAPNVFGRFYPSWRSQILGGYDLGAHEKAEATIFQDQMNKACNGRCFFVTEKGCMGLGPAEVQKRNSVAVLLGGSVPFVLHEQQMHFNLVGECYIHGLMNGEAIKDETVCLDMIQIR